MKIKYFTLIFALCIISLHVVAQKNILFVGVDGDVSGTPDYYLIDEIEYAELDYSVTYISGPDYKADDTYKTAAAYASYDAVFFSESCGSADIIGYKDAGFPIPTIVTEGFAPKSDKWGLIVKDAEYHQQVNSDEIEYIDGTTDPKPGFLIITDNTHYITSVFTENYELDWTTDEERGSGLAGCGVNFTENIPDAVPLANYSLAFMSDYPMMWAIPDGATLVSDPAVTMPNMVFIGTFIATLGEFATDDINTVFIRSLQWAMDDMTAISEHNPSITTTYAILSPNPARDEAKISFHLQEASVVGLTFYDLTGRIVHTLPFVKYAPGENTLMLNLSTLESTIYIYSLEINGRKSQGRFEVVH